MAGCEHLFLVRPMSPRKPQLGESTRVAIVAVTIVLSTARAPAPITEETPTPSKTPIERATPKRTRNHQSGRRSGEASGRTPLPTPKKQATPTQAVAAGRWVGTLPDVPGKGDVVMTLTVNTTATAVSENSGSYFHTSPATFDGVTLMWTSMYNCRYTLTPRPDGQTAVVTEACPGVFGVSAYSTSTTFRKTP